MRSDYEYIVLGCGGIGSATSYWLARRKGVEVLGIEQFELGHHHGGSQDHSRIIPRPDVHLSPLLGYPTGARLSHRCDQLSGLWWSYEDHRCPHRPQFDPSLSTGYALAGAGAADRSRATRSPTAIRLRLILCGRSVSTRFEWLHKSGVQAPEIDPRQRFGAVSHGQPTRRCKCPPKHRTRAARTLGATIDNGLYLSYTLMSLLSCRTAASTWSLVSIEDPCLLMLETQQKGSFNG